MNEEVNASGSLKNAVQLESDSEEDVAPVPKRHARIRMRNAKNC